MPLYVYKCSVCTGSVEIFHSISSTPVNCPLCNSTNSLERSYNYVITVSNQSSSEHLSKRMKGHLEEIKQNLEEQKKELTGKEYKPNA